MYCACLTTLPRYRFEVRKFSCPRTHFYLPRPGLPPATSCKALARPRPPYHSGLVQGNIQGDILTPNAKPYTLKSKTSTSSSQPLRPMCITIYIHIIYTHVPIYIYTYLYMYTLLLYRYRYAFMNTLCVCMCRYTFVRMYACVQIVHDRTTQYL